MVGEDYKVGTSYKFRVPLRDSTGTLQTGKSATVTIYLPDDTTEANPPTVSELGTTGVYGFSYTPAAAGAYTFILQATDCVPVVWTIQVRGLSRDELALESGGNLAAVRARADTYLDVTVSSRAAPGDAMTLTSAEREALADAVLDEDVQSAEATAPSLRAAAKAAWAQGFGKWVLNETTLTLYGPDGTTVVRTFTLDSATAPTRREPA